MSVSKVYAKALYGAATENKPADQAAALCAETEAQLEAVTVLVEGSKDLRMALMSPLTSAKEKAALVRELVSRMGANKLLGDFLSLLAAKGRLSELRSIRDEFGAVKLVAEGGVPGRLVSAEPVGEQDVEGLAKAFGKKLGKKVRFRVSTDPALLAGMKVTVNGVTYDGTLRSQIQKLRDRLVVGGPSSH
jgi:F-type H+-transporting ATPase subunit delta